MHLHRELRQLVVIHLLSEDERCIDDVIPSDDESRLVQDPPVRPDSGKKFSREAVGVGSLVHQEPRLGPDRLEIHQHSAEIT